MAAYRNIYQFSIVSQNGDDVDIFISKKNYAGVCYQRSLGRAPMLKRERNGNILGTSLEIYAECKVDGEFSQLYTSSADEFRVEVYRNRVLQWTGFVSPELYSEPDIAPPYDVQIIATDGLGELKNALFSQDLLSLHNHLNNILEHTGLILPIGIVSSLSWDDQQVNHSPYTLLTDTGIDLSNRIDDSCYDVLQDILRSLNACITQQAGGWLLIRESDLYDNVEKLSPVSFGSVNKAEWWPIGNLSSEIIPAKKRLTLVQENKYRENLLTPIYTGVAGGWDLTSGVFYDDIEKGYVIPSSSDSISYAIDFRSYPLQTQLRLTLRARSISRDEIREEASKMSLAIMMTGRINGTSGVYHLTPDFLSDNDRTQMKWFGGDKLGFIRSWDAPRASEGEPAIQDIEVIIPLYNNGVNKYAAADQLTIKISNAPNSPYRLCIYDAILKADQQYPGVKVVADIANDAREEASEINVALATSPDPMLEATMYGRLNGDGGIVSIYTPANSASDLLSFLVRDYAMQVALPRMRYRGKLNVPSMAHPVIPMIFERDSTYYFLNTYSYDLLNDELEVELVSIPNASVIIESETVTELPSVGSASGSSSGSGSSGGGGTSGGGGGSSTLAGLADVQVGGVQNGQALVYENGYWVPRTVSGGGSLSSDAIIAALGYTPFNSNAFTKANIKNALGIKDWALAASKPSYTWTEIGSRPTALSAFTNDLGLGSLAYKSSLVASDIPSLPWSKITSGKPTTLSGYGITDAILYEKAIDLSSAYHSMGYGHASKGWKTSGPAVVFGDTSYNLAMQCAIANADYVSLYLRMKYNGVEKGWDRVVTEGLLRRGAIAFDTPAYKSYGDYVLHRNAEGGDTFLNYGAANNDSASLGIFGNNINFYAGNASSYNTYLHLNNSGTAIFFVPLTLNKGVKIPQGEALQSGDGSLTYDGVSFNFSKETNSLNFPIGGILSADPSSSFRQTCFGRVSSHYALRVMRPGNEDFDGVATRYGAFLAISSSDTHGYIHFPAYDSLRDKCYIGGGTVDALKWKATLFHNDMNLVPKSDNTYTLGNSSYKWKEVHAVSIKIGDATLTWDASAGMLKIDKGVYSEGAITAKKKA